LVDRAATQSGNSSLLRMYWYDAIQGPRMSLEHSTLAHHAGVKLRLGSLNNAGEQKGVDSLIVTDLIELARNTAIADAVIVSGDEDLRIAVQVAQTYGVRVHILAVGDASRNVSASLQMEADSVDVLDAAWLHQHLLVSAEEPKRPPPRLQAGAPVAANAVTVEEAARDVAAELLRDREPHEIAELRAHFEANQTVPPEYDGKLIAKTSRAIGQRLTPDESRKVRGVFVNAVRGKA
jgi:uncharacterized LabA/DUF88 family protein